MKITSAYSSIQAPILYRLGDMLRGYGAASFDVGDGAGDLQDAVVGPGGQAEADKAGFMWALA
jgi:hypothetical protein